VCMERQTRHKSGEKMEGSFSNIVCL